MNQIGNAFGGSPDGSPLVVLPGPLTMAAFESGMSVVEELKPLKTKVQDVSRVCQAVAPSDLSQKIMIHIQGVVMVQLKDVIDMMVRFLPLPSRSFLPNPHDDDDDDDRETVLCCYVPSDSIDNPQHIDIETG